ncbi:MAG TPA: hypothetical protein DD415_02725 [Clostridiales bacterium]|nr:hypothetical protein [Clostridiales bacterium]
MIINREEWRIQKGASIWFGRYKNSRNVPHWHYECELIYVDKGELDVLCNSVTYRVCAGQTVFIDGKTIHSTNAATPDTEITMIVFDTGMLDFITGGLTPERPLFENYCEIPALYSRLKEEYSHKKQFYFRRMMVELTATLIDALRKERLIKKKASLNTTDRVFALMEDAAKNCADYDFERAAKFMNMNPAYFSRLFHKLTGITFSQYLNYVRCERAVNMLNENTDLTITEIASRSGFMTIRNFNRTFKSITGYSPKTLPKGFVLTNRYDTLNEQSINPTLNECLLLESSDE